MNLNKNKYFKGLFFTILTLGFIWACKNNTNNYSDTANYIDNTKTTVTIADKYSDIIELATFTMNQYNAGKLDIGNVIYDINIDEFEADSNISELFSSHEYFYKTIMKDENTVIVQKNVIFQSIIGYVVTTEKSLDTYEYGRFPCLNIPSALGYDGDSVSIDGYIGECDNLFLYSFVAGL